jgi:hypothetical protein
MRTEDERAREENERARRQDERARLSFEVDMMFKLEDRWESPTFLDRRRKAANHVKEHFATDDGGLLDVDHIDENIRLDTLNQLNFFEQLGAFVRQEVIRAETVWHTFGMDVRQHWALYRPAIERMREEHKDATLAEDFERLDALMADLDRQHGVGDEDITNQQLRRYIESESRALAT